MSSAVVRCRSLGGGDGTSVREHTVPHLLGALSKDAVVAELKPPHHSLWTSSVTSASSR